MAGEMFGLETVRMTHGTRRWYAMPFAVLTHVFVIGALVAVPLLATNSLPTPESVLAFVTPPPAPTPPPPPVAPQPAQPPITVTADNSNAAPTEAPSVITEETPPTLTSLVVIRTPTATASDNTVGTLAAPPPPPVERPTGPIRVGGDIKEPRKLQGAPPVYPMIARAARIEGSVLLEATIGKDGTVKDIRVIGSAPMLDDAAVAAVREWRYTVPRLNGQPIDVLMTVTVHFGLGR